MIRLILKGGKLSRWSVFLVDVFICTFVIYLAYLLRFNFQIPQSNQEQLLFSIPFVLFIRIISFVVFRTYSGVILHTSTEDAIRILLAVTSGTVVILFSNLVSLGFTEKFIVHHSILIIDYMASMFFLTGFRIFIKVLYLELTNAQKEV